MPRPLIALAAVLGTLLVPAAAPAQYDLPKVPDVTVRVIRPKPPVAAGTTYTWRVRVRNVGTATARTVVVRARWGASLVRVRGGRVNRRRRESTFRVAAIAPGRSRTFRLTGFVRPGAKSVSVRASADFTG